MSSLQRKSLRSSLEEKIELIKSRKSLGRLCNSLVHWNFFQKLVLVEIVHHVDLFVVVGRENAVENSVDQRLITLCFILSDTLGVNHGQIVAGSFQVRLILIEEDLKRFVSNW